MLRNRLIVAAVTGWIAMSAFAAEDVYVIDPMHTYPSFEFPHMGISVWRGKFDKTSGTIAIDRVAQTGTVDIHVDAASIDFGLDAMQSESRSDKFFDVAKYPTATYKGTLRFTGDVPTSIDGKITLLGVTAPLTLTINSTKCIPDMMTKKERCGADAQGEVNWSKFGMKMSKWGEGDMGIVHLRIQVEGLKRE